MSDLIDRQAAIDALADYIHNVDKVIGTGHLTADDCKDAAASVFEELPSAQPTQNERVSSNNPLDCISRQAAIRWVKTECNPYGNPTLDFESGKKVIEHLKQMPSAQPEQCSDCIANGGDWECDHMHCRKGRFPSAQPEERWIPCSERLPEYDGEMYLVTDYCEQINRRRLHISYCYVNREGFWSDVPMGYKVIAWMPLPKPWKGEKDG